MAFLSFLNFCGPFPNLMQNEVELFSWALFLLIILLFRKLYIADARPRKNALANGAMGGGSESSSNYFQSEVCQRFELFSNGSIDF